MQRTKKQIKKLIPKAEAVILWVIRAIFELMKLAALAYMIMHVISAAFAIEVALASIVVFASFYFTTIKR